MTRTIIPLLEKTTYDYLYVDEKNNVHLLIPLVGGGSIASDNTCQSLVEIRKFFGFAGNRSGLAVINEYIKDLRCDILILETNKDSSNDQLLKNKKDRLLQLQHYLDIWPQIRDSHDLRISLMFRRVYPDEMQQDFEEKDANCASIFLSPDSEDSVTALNRQFALFSVTRVNHMGAHSVTGFGATLRNHLIAVDVKKRSVESSSKDKLIKTAMDVYKQKRKKEKVEDEDDLTFLKDRIFEIYTAIKPEAKDAKDSKDTVAPTRAMLDTFLNFSGSSPMAITVETIRTNLDAIESLSLQEVVEEVIINNTLAYAPQGTKSPLDRMDEASALNASPFDEVHREVGDEKHQTGTIERERLSIRIQFLVAMINLHFYAQGKKVNLGQMLEAPIASSSETLGDKLAKLITDEKFLLRPGLRGYQIEDLIINFIDEHIARDVLGEKLSLVGIKAIKDNFREKYNFIKESPHFDEFLIFLRNKPAGAFFNWQNRISYHFGKFLQKKVPASYHLYFTGETPRLNTTISAPDRKSHASFYSEVNGLPAHSVIERDQKSDIDLDKIIQAAGEYPNTILAELIVSGVKLDKAIQSKIQSSSRWPQIQREILLQELSVEELQKISTRWTIPPTCLLTKEMVQAVYSHALSSASQGEHISLKLLEKQGLPRILHHLNIAFETCNKNENGTYTVTFQNIEQLAQIRKFNEIAKQKLHITRSMARSIYLEVGRITGKPFEFKGNETTQARITRALNEIGISGFRVIDLDYNGYMLESQNLRDIDRLRQIHFDYCLQHPNVLLTKEQCREICLKNKVTIASDEKTEVYQETVLQAFRHQAEGGLDVIVASMDPLPDGNFRVVLEDDRATESRFQSGFEKLRKICPSITLLKDIPADLAEVLYSKVYSKHGADSLYGLSGAAKLKKALDLLGIVCNTVTAKESGGFSTVLSNISQVDKVDAIYQESRTRMHISRAMARSLYLAAGKTKPFEDQKDEKPQDRLIRALKQIGITGFSKVTENDACDGYVLESGNRRVFDKVNEIYYDYFVKLRSIKISPEQCRKICERASEKRTKVEIKGSDYYSAFKRACDFEHLNVVAASIDCAPEDKSALRVLIEDDTDSKSSDQKDSKAVVHRSGLSTLLTICPDIANIPHPITDSAKGGSKAITAEMVIHAEKTEVKDEKDHKDAPSERRRERRRMRRTVNSQMVADYIKLGQVDEALECLRVEPENINEPFGGDDKYLLSIAAIYQAKKTNTKDWKLYIDLIDEMLRLGLEVNAQQGDGNTLLHKVAWFASNEEEKEMQDAPKRLAFQKLAQKLVKEYHAKVDIENNVGNSVINDEECQWFQNWYKKEFQKQATREEKESITITQAASVKELQKEAKEDIVSAFAAASSSSSSATSAVASTIVTNGSVTTQTDSVSVMVNGSHSTFGKPSKGNIEIKSNGVDKRKPLLNEAQLAIIRCKISTYNAVVNDKTSGGLFGSFSLRNLFDSPEKVKSKVRALEFLRDHYNNPSYATIQDLIKKAKEDPKKPGVEDKYVTDGKWMKNFLIELCDVTQLEPEPEPKSKSYFISMSEDD